MTRRYHANNISTTLLATITNVQTTLVVTSATGFPTITTNETFNITVTQNNQIEIMIVTAATGTSFTVTRGAEGTTAQSFLLGASIELRVTADSLDRKADIIATAGDALNFGDAASLEIPNASAPTVSVTGQIALDTTDTNFTAGFIRVYNGAIYAIPMMPIAQYTSPTNNHVITYNSSTKQFELKATTGGGQTYTTVSGTTQAAAINNTYITNNASLVTVTLPATAALGSQVEVMGLGAGGWKLAANTGQTIKVAGTTTSSAGSLSSTNQYDTIIVKCIVANTTWAVIPATAGYTVL